MARLSTGLQNDRTPAIRNAVSSVKLTKMRKYHDCACSESRCAGGCLGIRVDRRFEITAGKAS